MIYGQATLGPHVAELIASIELQKCDVKRADERDAVNI